MQCAKEGILHTAKGKEGHRGCYPNVNADVATFNAVLEFSRPLATAGEYRGCVAEGIAVDHLDPLGPQLLLEAVIAAVLISLLIVVFFGRILSMSASIERESMQQTISHLNSALNIEALTLIVQNNQEAIANWDGKNPMRLINPPPLQYRGSFSDTDAFQVSPGSWFFDEKNGLLIYRINHIEAFAGGRAIPERVRFRVEASFNDMNNNQRHDENERYTGLKLRALDDYQWSSATGRVKN